MCPPEGGWLISQRVAHVKSLKHPLSSVHPWTPRCGQGASTNAKLETHLSTTQTPTNLLWSRNATADFTTFEKKGHAVAQRGNARAAIFSNSKKRRNRQCVRACRNSFGTI